MIRKKIVHPNLQRYLKEIVSLTLSFQLQFPVLFPI